MKEDKIIDVLQEAGQTAGTLAPVSANLADSVRRRARKRHFRNIAAPVAATAMMLIALGIWQLPTEPGRKQEQERIVALEARLQQLQARTDTTLKLIREVLENERRQHRLEELEAKLASIPDPLKEIQEQIDKTAFILCYQADRMYREFNQKDSAVKTYNRVVELFPHSGSAEVAKQRLAEIQNDSVSNNGSRI